MSICTVQKLLHSRPRCGRRVQWPWEVIPTCQGRAGTHNWVSVNNISLLFLGLVIFESGPTKAPKDSKKMENPQVRAGLGIVAHKEISTTCYRCLSGGSGGAATSSFPCRHGRRSSHHHARFKVYRILNGSCPSTIAQPRLIETETVTFRKQGPPAGPSIRSSVDLPSPSPSPSDHPSPLLTSNSSVSVPLRYTVGNPGKVGVDASALRYAQSECGLCRPDCLCDKP